MAGGIDCPHWNHGIRLNRDGDLLQWLQGIFFRIQWIGVLNQSMVGSQNLLIFQLNPPFPLRRNWKNACLDGTPANVLQQCGITHGIDNFLVGLACLVGSQNHPFHRFSIHPERKIADNRIKRERKNVCPLHDPIVWIIKNLVHVGNCQLILDRHSHMVVADDKLGHWARGWTLIRRARRYFRNNNPIRRNHSSSGK